MNGQFSDALHHYHEVIAIDPDNYQILYRRATVFLATGKTWVALADLNRVIALKPNFIAVYLYFFIIKKFYRLNL